MRPDGAAIGGDWVVSVNRVGRGEPDGVHVAGPVPDLRRPVPDCSVIAQRRLTAGTDPYRGRADVPGATSGKPWLGKPSAPKPPRAFRSLRVARQQRGKAVRLQLRISRGPARVTVRLTAPAPPPVASCGGARGGGRCDSAARSTRWRSARWRAPAASRCGCA